MAKVSLVLADSDNFFSQKFCRYILEHNNFYDIIAFTEQDYLVDYLTKNSVNLLLIEKSFATEEILKIAGNCLVIMLNDVSGEANGYSCVSKYQKTENLVKEITFKYAESIGDKSIVAGNDQLAQVIAVYSPQGGAGSTSVAAALSTVLAQNGYRAVYFNMEKVNSGLFIMDSEAEGLSDIFLKIKSKSTNLSFEVTKRLQTDGSGVKFFAPAQSGMEFNEMSSGEIVEIIKETAGCGECQFVVVDLPTELSENIIDVLKISDHVVCVTTNDVIGTNKLRVFINEINFFPELRIVYEKFLPVINKSEIGGVDPNIQQIFGEKVVMASIPYINGLNKCQSAVDIGRIMDNYLMEVVRKITGR